MSLPVENTSASSMILRMNRPQYVSLPEGFIASLAWRVFEWDAKPKSAGRPIALTFLMKQESTSSQFELRATAPEGDGITAFGCALKKHGIGPESIDEGLLAEAVLNSVTGIRAEKSTIQAASPLTPAFALLQNMRGLQKTKSPPDLAEILESLYWLGKSERASGSSGVAQRWLDASEYRCKSDPLLRAMDSAVRESLLGNGLRVREAATREPAVTAAFPNTPFSWFARTWDRLTSQEWVDALPARVWVDWATTVLRLALGAGFLWEAAWYETLARKLLVGEPFTRQEVMESMPEVLPWRSSRSSISVRDVASPLVWRVHKGAAIRRLLIDWLDEFSQEQVNFDGTILDMQADEDLLVLLTEALGSQQRVAPNTWEAIKYALLTRDVAGPYADYYGLLRQSGRFLTVEPGTEWIAVVASLACESPNGSTNVGQLMDDLAELGVVPEVADVVALLENAGLARGSADADQGVRMTSAF